MSNLTRKMTSSVIVVFLLLPATSSPGAATSRSWMELGYVQYLEGPNELWIFAEVQKVTEKKFGKFTAPLKKDIAEQYIFKLKDNGVKEKIVLQHNGPTFNSNISTIMKMKSDLYLYKSPSLGKRAEIFILERGKFTLIDDINDSNNDVREILAIQKIHADKPSGNIAHELEMVSEKNGWSTRGLSALELGLSDQISISKTREYYMEVKLSKEMFRPISLTVESRSKEHRWVKCLIDLD